MDVELTLPRRRVFVGSFTPVTVAIDPASGLTDEDLRYELSSPGAGVVSVARGPKYDPKRPEVMLLGGHELGKHELVAIDKNSGAAVGATTFALTDRWGRRKKRGPGFWFSSDQDISHPIGSAWGGGPSTPQNTRPTPISGTWRIALVFVDTSSARYSTAPADQAALRDLWMDELTDGVLDHGKVRSVRTFYEEASYGNLTLSVTPFGPYNLSGAWGSYFDTSDSSFKGTLVDATIAAADADIDFRDFDTVIMVSPRVPATATQPERAAWPFASIGKWGPYTTGDGALNLGFISMVADWGQQPGNDREIFETASHELGHNLGLWDQYTPSVAGRNPGGWDLMDADDPHPHMSVSQKMRLGWVRPEWVRTLNFSASGGPLDQTFRLHPLELGAPPAGQSKAIEVRIADGANYYFEYRKEQAPQIGDQDLPADSRVLGTDVATDPSTAPIPRPQVLLLPKHANDDGAVLTNGSKYIDTDYTTPGFPQEFRVDVSATNGTGADVRVRYGANGRPDPSIRPWPASPSRPWQSPDIEVRNARSATRPEWANVPWSGHANTVVATVRNNGTVAANGVVVNFYVKNYTLSNAPETFLGSDTRSIPPGGAVEFNATWNAPASGHYCVIARIPLFQDAGTGIVELTELNNMAQSNYDRFIPSTASPSTRESTTVEVSNPYDEPTYVYLNAGQTNPTYRVLVSHRWLRLKAKQTKRVQVMFEWAPVRGEDRLPDDLGDMNWDEVMKLTQVPNRVGLSAWALHPKDPERHSLGLLGGAMAEVQVGRKVIFEEVDAQDEAVFGRLITTDDAMPVTGGSVIVTLDPSGDGKPEGYRYVDGEVDQEGAFAVKLRGDWRRLWVDYLPAQDYSTATSEVFSR
ncbi:hypothetical protein E8D34_10575 [Nocardioides sp. GY 10113]|uniref:CARDB domain-containing protein n=1 Tax=Nocardioides sp. GY 10113 TaxID=2569761 RepID=UPI0010A88A60|nr:CARDB domain-containing protein [Nocardioides sp. GY 10113]TIC87549.1 hypothetical protein E8D34_10575 [Nocardioides sp. GY 10113]